MGPHPDFYQSNPAAIQVAIGLEKALTRSTLEESLTELVRLRVLQINSCTYCVDLHTADARRGGEDGCRLATVSVWHETSLFTDHKHAVLAWTGAVMLVTETRVPGDVWQAVRAQFSDAELADLTLLVSTVNTWDRLAVSFRKLPV